LKTNPEVGRSEEGRMKKKKKLTFARSDRVEGRRLVLCRVWRTKYGRNE